MEVQENEITCWPTTRRINMGKPISTQLASCSRKNSILIRLIIIFQQSLTCIPKCSNFTIGKPLINKPRPTTQTRGTITTGVKSLTTKRKSIT